MVRSHYWKREHKALAYWLMINDTDTSLKIRLWIITGTYPKGEL